MQYFLSNIEKHKLKILKSKHQNCTIRIVNVLTYTPSLERGNYFLFVLIAFTFIKG